MNHFVALIAGGLAGLCIAASPAAAQEIAMPVDIQFSLFYRIMGYDRGIATRSASGLVVGVLYQGGFRSSVQVKNDAVRQRPPAGSGYEVRFVPIDLDTTDDLAAAIQAAGCNVLYIAPLRAVRAASITALTRARRILTLTGVPAYVESGIAVGIGINNQRPEILVNLGAARAEGITFSAQLLRLARVL